MRIRALREWPSETRRERIVGRWGHADSHSVMDGWLIRRLAAGWHPRAVASASGGRVSLRTAYRWQGSRLEDVRIGDHVATFAIRRDQPPTRVGPWRGRPVDDAASPADETTSSPDAPGSPS